MRASFMVLGPLLARFGHARVSAPGGCAIGARPDRPASPGLEELGAKIAVAKATSRPPAGRLRGAGIAFDLPSVGATQKLMMAAALADGATVIENAAREPEIECLATCSSGWARA